MSDKLTSDIVSVGWLTENKILKVQIGGDPDSHTMTIANGINYDEVVMRYLSEATQPISILLHIQPFSRTPSISHLLSLKYLRHPLTGYIVIVNTSNTPMVRFFMSIVGGVSRVKIKGFQSVDEGMEFLQTLGVQP